MTIVVIRWIIMVLCIAAALVMMRDFHRRREHLNSKAREFYFGRFMWLAVGISGMIEGLVHHTPFRYTLVFLFLAAASTFKAVATKGPWGDSE